MAVNLNTVHRMDEGLTALLFEAQQRLSCPLPNNIERYVIYVLVVYSRELWSQEPLGIQLLEAHDKASLERVGTTALMLTAFQADAKKRKHGIQRDYYVACGQAAFASRASCAQSTERRRLFSDMSKHFDPTARVVEATFLNKKDVTSVESFYSPNTEGSISIVH